MAFAWAAVGLAAPARAAESGPLARCIEVQARKLDFSGVVSVVQPAGATVYTQGRLDGPASPEINADTRFNLASAGKMFTAVAVAQLVDAGRVGLDDPIGRYVKGLTVEAGLVTVRQLLTHSSGLGNYFTPENIATIQKAHAVADLLPLISSDKPSFKPGSRFEYSNSGFVLLGLLIEAASGESYGDYLRHHVFAPAAMTATSLEPGAAADRAVGLTRVVAAPTASPGGGGGMLLRSGADGAPPQGPLRPSAEAAVRGGPAGGSYSTANDMQRFLEALTEGRLTSPSMVRALTSGQIVVSPAKDGLPERDYGLGFGVGVFEGRSWAGHNGGAPGINTEVATYPEDRAAVVVLSDRDPPTATALFRQVREMMFKSSCS